MSSRLQKLVKVPIRRLFPNGSSVTAAMVGCSVVVGSSRASNPARSYRAAALARLRAARSSTSWYPVGRSEERSVGKEGVSTGRTRWSSDDYKKKKIQKNGE